MVPPGVWSSLEDARKDRAQMDIMVFESAAKKAIKANTKDGKGPPQTVEEVLPYITGSGAYNVDPWGNRYQLRWIEAKGERLPVVSTVAPDGTVISNLRD
jgi:hypothetical protein